MVSDALVDLKLNNSKLSSCGNGVWRELPIAGDT